jgi:hypothetical protein
VVRGIAILNPQMKNLVVGEQVWWDDEILRLRPQNSESACQGVAIFE